MSTFADYRDVSLCFLFVYDKGLLPSLKKDEAEFFIVESRDLIEEQSMKFRTDRPEG